MVATFSHAVADTPTKVVIDVRGTSEEPPPHLRVLSAAFALNLNATIALGTAISVTSDQQVHVELACLVGLLTVDMVTVPLAVNASEIARHAVMPKHTGTRLELRGPASLVRTLLATTEYSGVEAGSDRVRITMDEEEEEEILIWVHPPVTAGATRGAPARVGGQGLQFYGKSPWRRFRGDIDGWQIAHSGLAPHLASFRIVHGHGIAARWIRIRRGAWARSHYGAGGDRGKRGGRIGRSTGARGGDNQGRSVVLY